MDFALESIVGEVDLRLPQKPPPILFQGGTAIDEEVIAAIRRSMGDGEIVTTSIAEDAPRYTIFISRSDGRIDALVYVGIKRCFRKHGSEACVFEYLTIEKFFRLRTPGYFVPERIAHA